MDATGWPIRQWGVIDQKGDIIVSAKHQMVWSYKEGFANVVDDGKWGFLDLEGNLAIPCQFDVAEPFENGLAFVRVGSYYGAKNWNGYIDKRGKFVWRPHDFKARDAARRHEELENQKKNKKPSISLFSDPKSKEKGLLVTCPSKIPLKGENAGEVPIQVFNLSDDEVFIEVTKPKSLSYSVEFRTGGSAGGGGGAVIFPDNINLLKRLHASTVQDGKQFTCGCCIMEIEGKLDAGALDSGRARGTVSVRIRGYYRKNGKGFSEFIDLPIELVEPTDNLRDGSGPADTQPGSK